MTNIQKYTRGKIGLSHNRNADVSDDDSDDDRGYSNTRL